MGKNDRRVLIVGAGVSGLTTAIVLATAGFSVRIVADRPPLRTTSAAAGASWSPYLVNHPMATQWSALALTTFETLARAGSTGVRIVGGIEASKEEVPIPHWARDLPTFRRCGEDELPSGYCLGWWFEVPVVTMSVYLTYLEKRLRRQGVTVEQRRVDSLDSLCRNDIVVVNCTGAYAAQLCADGELVPTRGQLVVVDNPGLETFFQDHSEEGEELIYYLPHGDHVILGGSARQGITDLTPDDGIARAIRARCAKVEPRLAGARFRGHRVGLRPSRSEVRLEAEERPGGLVIHNYGHGGAGVTLSWGCAQTVLELVNG
jgi:D-amino-acid oxidase